MHADLNPPDLAEGEAEGAPAGGRRGGGQGPGTPGGEGAVEPADSCGSPPSLPPGGGARRRWGAPLPGRGRPGRAAGSASPALAGGGAGAGRAGARAGGGGGRGGGRGGGLPLPLSRPRGRLYKPAGVVAPAASRSRHSEPSVPEHRPHVTCARTDLRPRTVLR